MWLKSGLLILILLPLACDRTYYYNPTSPTNTTTVNTTPVITKDKIEFHVIGNALGARVKYSSGVEGLNQITTVLPFQSTITSSNDSIFLYLEAQATLFSGSVVNPFMDIQIFVNGNLFREASSNSSLLETISVSGTYRR